MTEANRSVSNRAPMDDASEINLGELTPSHPIGDQTEENAIQDDPKGTCAKCIYWKIQ